MVTADRILVVLAVALLLLALVSRLTTRHSLSPVVLALVTGVVLGPDVLGVLDLTSEIPRHVLLEQVTRVALALLVSTIALRVRPADLRDNAARLLVLLGLVMPGMWLVTAAGVSLTLGVPVGVALVLGAVLTPTDPGVSSTVSTGTLAERSLPRRLRMSLQVESAANDGLTIPFVILAGLLVTLPAGAAVGEWAATVAQELGVAVVVGVAVGWLTTLMLRSAEKDRAVAQTYLPLVGPAMSVSALAIASLLGGTGVLAAFVAALTLSLTFDDQESREQIQNFEESVGHAALIAVFLTFGTVLPFRGWWDLGLPGVLFVLWVVLLRRLPVAVAALRTTRTGWRTAGFLGWFGPLGVAGIYYLAYVERYALPDYERLFAAGSLAVVASVLVAAVTATAGVLAYRSAAGSEVPDGESSTLPGRLP